MLLEIVKKLMRASVARQWPRACSNCLQQVLAITYCRKTECAASGNFLKWYALQVY